jgi:predicted nucleotidyltransferase
MTVATYGERLIALAVFGSWARGEATSASDLDLLAYGSGGQQLEYLALARSERLGRRQRLIGLERPHDPPSHHV